MFTSCLDTFEMKLHPVAQPPCVLVVDDDAVSRQVFSLQLEKIGYQVDTAANGDEALAAFACLRYALVLVDILLPGMSGFELIAHLRRLPGGDGVPVVAVSAGIPAVSRAACLAVGFDDFLAKPVGCDTLTEVVERYLGRERE